MKSFLYLITTICLFGTLIFQNPLPAQEIEDLMDLSLDDLLNMEVTTASKKAEKTADAPGIITTITSEEIKYFGANSLKDILERATSIQMMSSYLYPSNSTIMRGDLRTIYDMHILILINGRPVREGVTGGINSPVYNAFPIDMIEKIEIIRGPGSVLYGSNAFAGVINIITKSSKMKNSLKVRTTAGSFGMMDGVVTGSYVKQDFTAKVSAKFEDTEGWDYKATATIPWDADVLIDRKYGQKNLGIAADLSYRDLSFSAFYTNDEHDEIGTLPYPTTTNYNNYNRLFLNLGYVYKISETWDATLNLTHNYTELSLSLELGTSSSEPQHQAADYLAELTFGGEVIENVNLIFGGVFESRNKDDATETSSIPNYHLEQYSTYLQADYRPIDQLKLIAGAQMNKPEGKDLDVVPRAGAIYNFKQNFGIKTLYAMAFRSPWPTESLFRPIAVLQGNPDLNPEKIATLDFQLFYSSPKAEAAITVYNSKYTESIVREPIPTDPGTQSYYNRGELNMNGLEVEGKVSVGKNIFITGSATYQNNADEDEVPVYIPDFMGKIGAFMNIRKGLTIGVFNTLFGKPKENEGVKANPVAKVIPLLSININYKLPLKVPLEVNLYGQNLLDKDYYYTEYGRNWVNTLPIGPGIAFYGGISVRF